MKFVIGYPEPSDDFQPESDGWRLFQDPGGHADIVKVGFSFSITLGLFFYWASFALAGFSINQLFDEFDLWVFLIMGVLIVVHEGLHAMLHPDFGLSKHLYV